jgi:hypothetical protein
MPGPETRSATCADCYWSASGPWAWEAADSHQEEEPTHLVFRHDNASLGAIAFQDVDTGLE